MVMTHAHVTRSSDAADDALSQSKPRELLYNRHGTGSLGQRVNGSFESSFMVFVFLLCACSSVVAMWKINSLSLRFVKDGTGLHEKLQIRMYSTLLRR